MMPSSPKRPSLGSFSTSDFDSSANSALGSKANAAPPPKRVGPKIIIRTTLTIDVPRRGMPRGIQSFALVALKEGLANHDATQLVVVSGRLDRALHVWNIETGEALSILEGHKSVVHTVCVHESSSALVSLDTMGDLIVWDLLTLSCMQVVPHADADSRITALCSVPETDSLITASRQLRLWKNARAVTNEEERVIKELAPEGHHHAIVASAYSETFCMLLTADSSNVICVWDVKTGAQVFKFDHAAGSPGTAVTAMSLDESERRLLTGASDGESSGDISSGISSGIHIAIHERLTHAHTPHSTWPFLSDTPTPTHPPPRYPALVELLLRPNALRDGLPRRFRR